MQTDTAMLYNNVRQGLLRSCLFGAFVFLQFSTLGLANHAGEGYLETGQRDLIYYALQVFVILGFLLYGLCFSRCAGRRIGRALAYGIFGVFFACAAMMLTASPASLAYVYVSMVAALCLGGIGGAVHMRMSMATIANEDAARCMGIGSAAAVVMQYLLQIQWGVTPLLPVAMLAAFALLLSALLHESPKPGTTKGVEPGPTSPRRMAVTVLIASTFILFACFYNEYIHHLMIQSDYAPYTVYSWPRLALVPGYLLFAALGDRKGGKYVPLAALCIMLIALLNVVLVGSRGTYWLNMCLFYFAIAAFTSYYLLSFWRLAPGMGNPALWAPFGRMLDSGMVLLAGVMDLSALPAPAVLGMDIAGVALVIVLMALNGDFNLAETPSLPEEPVLTLQERTSLFAHERGLTEREGEVLALLVLTEDKNQLIADKLGISRRRLQTHISHIYEKTGATSRAGLIVRVNGD